MIGSDLVFVVDDREKLPYILPNPVVRRLEVGDYSLEGWENRLAIERKSYDDLFSCLTAKLDRFHKQLRALSQLDYKAVCVDTTVTAMRFGHVYCPIAGEEAIARLVDMSVGYGVPVFFCDRMGSVIAADFLYSAWKKLTRNAPVIRPQRVVAI